MGSCVIIREIYHHQNYKPVTTNQLFLSVIVKYSIKIKHYVILKICCVCMFGGLANERD